MNSTTRVTVSGLVAATILTLSAGDADAQLLLRDDFNGSGIVDTTVWRLPFESEGTFVGRTLFRGDAATDVPLQGISVADGAGTAQVAEIHLDSYSPVDPGNAFLGTDLLTKRDFALGGGLTFEARMRLDPNAVGAGTVNGFFTFDLSGDGIRDEIDFELLGNQAVGNNDIFTNVFEDAPFFGPGSGGATSLDSVSNFNLTEFNNYKIEWTPQAVRWFINDNLIRSETNPANIPDDPQKLHFNIWAPDSGFTEAFDNSLQPTAVEANNQRFTSQIDWVEVNRINTTVSSNLLTDPSLEGALQLNVPAGTTTDTWFGFNQASFVFGGLDGAPTAADGFFVGKTFGPGFANTDASGFIQQVDAAPGEEFEVSAKVLTPSDDSIAGTENFTTVGLSFVDANGNVLETAPFVPLDGSDFPLLDGRDPNIVEDVYVEGTASAIAPEGTAFARVTLLYLQIIDGTPGPNGLGGAAFFDDVSLVRLTADAPPAIDGDYNGDTLVNAADYVIYRDGASPNGDGTLLDYNTWAANFGATGAPAVASSLGVPEPSCLLLALTAFSLVGARRR